jgi:hypothetical protein
MVDDLDLYCLKAVEIAVLLRVSIRKVESTFPFIRLGPRTVRYPIKDVKERWAEFRKDVHFEDAIQPFVTKPEKNPESKWHGGASYIAQKGNYKVPIFPITGRVYFATDGQLIKIGYAKKPLKRLSTLQTGIAHRLHLLAAMHGSIQMERHIHDRFKAIRHRGEWFRAEPQLLRFIRQVASWKYQALKDFGQERSP